MKFNRLSILPVALMLTAAFSGSAGQPRQTVRRSARAHAVEKQSKEAYVFTYFTGNGEDGLHLAYSHDGLVWVPLNQGRSLLRPTVGKDKLMRDPQITRGTDARTTWSGLPLGRSL